MKSEHIEYHRLDAVQANGEVVSRVEQKGSIDTVGDEKPRVHSETQLDLNSKGIHKTVVQDDAHLSIMDATPTTAANEEQTTKVFHGAARLVQTGMGTSNPTNGHTAVRRNYNSDITKDIKNNMEHYAGYSGVQYSPLEMAEYVFWTGDERGVTNAIEEFLQEGMMSKEEAIAFLQEIKFDIEYLRAHYSQTIKAAEENAQQEKLASFLMDKTAKEYPYRPVSLQYPIGISSDISRQLSGKTWEISNSIGGASLPVSPPEIVKRAYDPMLQTNIVGTSDYDRDGPALTEEEYEEMMEKLRAADSLYTEYTLEEIIYQLAKMMFSQSLSRGAGAAGDAGGAARRFVTFLELEAARGHLSRIMRQFLEGSTSEPGVSRAVLASYRDELLNNSPSHKLPFNRN
ncbi:unnamed protein product [Leptidea sinapis]|uniref:Uncharacterized protein n=1 Tax=Leptidea sinapis TaxID=189913 RepID=A0A5E4QG12_9NEOP|nr:unnamed protein product [Leptidea sinapis]